MTVLQQKFGDLAKKSDEIADPVSGETLETTAQRFARNYIAKKMSELGFNVTAENVEISDQANALYRVKEVTFGQNKNIRITFDVLMSGEYIINVYLLVDGKPQVLNGKYTFEEFKNLIIAEIDLGKVGAVKLEKSDTVEGTEGMPSEGVTR